MFSPQTIPLRSLVIQIPLSCLLLGTQVVSAVDWLTLPGQFSHDPSGQRIAQHQAAAPALAPAVSDFTRGGYRNTRSTLQYDQGADNYHVVERWGPPVQPYDEWRFPYRPFSSPYPNWGPPFAGSGLGNGTYPGFSNLGTGYPGLGYGGGGFGGGGYPGFTPPPGGAYPHFPGSGSSGGGYSGQPWFDGSYPDSPARPSLDDRQFFAKPPNN